MKKNRSPNSRASVPLSKKICGFSIHRARCKQNWKRKTHSFPEQPWLLVFPLYRCYQLLQSARHGCCKAKPEIKLWSCTSQLVFSLINVTKKSFCWTVPSGKKNFLNDHYHNFSRHSTGVHIYTYAKVWCTIDMICRWWCLRWPSWRWVAVIAGSSWYINQLSKKGSLQW